MTSRDHITMGTLVDRIGRASKPMHVVNPEARGIVAEPPIAPNYVQPSLIMNSWPSDAHVIVIDAVAATGKTVLAEALSNKLRWPLVLGDQMQVGDFSVQGLVTSATGFASTFLADLVSGRQGIIIDALDEAELKAGRPNFISCLEDIAEIARQCVDGSGTRIILLARNECSTQIRHFLETKNEPFADLRLDFFTLGQAKEFIDTQVLSPRLRPSTLKNHDELTSPYRGLRDQRLTEIAAAINTSSESLEDSWRDVAHMLGYPPVLSSIATLVAVNNPAASDPLTVKDRASILLEICEQILDRESTKVRDALYNQLIAKLPADEPKFSHQLLYGRHEQIARISAETGLSITAVDTPASLPESIRDEYERHLRPFIANHPFLEDSSSGPRFSNLVFNDFVTSALISWDPDQLASLVDQDEINRAPGPFFARFLSLMREETTPLPRDYLVASIESLALEQEWLGLSTEAMLVADSQRCMLAILNESPTELLLDFAEGETLPLPHRLAHLLVLAEVPVHVGGAPALHLGPSVAIQSSSSVSLDGLSLSITADRGKGETCWIVAPRVASESLASAAVPEGSLKILSDSCPPLLHPFKEKLKTDVASPIGIPGSSFMDLRAILISFRPSVTPGLSCSADKMDRLVVGRSTNRQALFHALIDLGIITRTNNLYLLDLNLLGTLGFSINDFRDEPSKAVLRFLAKYQKLD